MWTFSAVCGILIILKFNLTSSFMISFNFKIWLFNITLGIIPNIFSGFLLQYFLYPFTIQCMIAVS